MEFGKAAFVQVCKLTVEMNDLMSCCMAAKVNFKMISKVGKSNKLKIVVTA